MKTAQKTIEIKLKRPHKFQQWVDSTVPRIVVKAGRRGGKTTGAATKAVKRFLDGGRVLYGAPTQEQVESFWWEVKTALEAPIDAGIFTKNETLHTIELPRTKQRIRAKTAWNADSLRGDWGDLLILDEYQIMSEDTWELVGAPMLLDNNGQALFIFTPPSLRSRSVTKARDPRHASKLFKRATEISDKRWAAFSFTSHDNPYIPREALEEIALDMSSLAYRQEIMAEDVDEVVGALWTRELIDRMRVSDLPLNGGEERISLARIAVGVDPPGGSTECGIVAAGLGTDGHIYITQDSSLLGSPDRWSKAVIDTFTECEADIIVGEKNYGGDMVESTIKQAAKDAGVEIRYKNVTATRGKAVRAEPIAARSERGMIHLVGSFPHLEDELCLARGSQIITIKGLKPIECVTSNDKVLTRAGFKKVAWAGQTGVASKLLKLSIGERNLLTTVHHPIYTKHKGFVPACYLQIGDELEVLDWDINGENLLSGTIKNGLSTIADITWIARANCCIEKFICTTSAKFREIWTYIIKMAISLITAPITLLACQEGNMLNNIRFMESQLLIKNNDESTLSIYGNKRLLAKSNVFTAPISSIPEPHLFSFALRNADENIITNLEVIDTDEPVYNLQIEEAPEFYANGVLVHNCMWVPGGTKESPNRLDAAVWSITELMPAKSGSWRPMRAEEKELTEEEKRQKTENMFYPA